MLSSWNDVRVLKVDRMIFGINVWNSHVFLFPICRHVIIVQEFYFMNIFSDEVGSYLLLQIMLQPTLFNSHLSHFYFSLIKPFITFIFPGSLYLLDFASWQYLLTSFAFQRNETHGSQDIMNADLQKLIISQSNIFCSISKCFCFQNCWKWAFKNDKLLK